MKIDKRQKREILACWNVFFWPENKKQKTIGPSIINVFFRYRFIFSVIIIWKLPKNENDFCFVIIHHNNNNNKGCMHVYIQYVRVCAYPFYSVFRIMFLCSVYYLYILKNFQRKNQKRNSKVFNNKQSWQKFSFQTPQKKCEETREGATNFFLFQITHDDDKVFIMGQQNKKIIFMNVLKRFFLVVWLFWLNKRNITIENKE